MKYVGYKTGGAENLEIQTTDLPQLRHREILMKVYATAINRADILQVIHLLKIRLILHTPSPEIPDLAHHIHSLLRLLTCTQAYDTSMISAEMAVNGSLYSR